MATSGSSYFHGSSILYNFAFLVFTRIHKRVYIRVPRSVSRTSTKPTAHRKRDGEKKGTWEWSGRKSSFIGVRLTTVTGTVGRKIYIALYVWRFLRWSTQRNRLPLVREWSVEIEWSNMMAGRRCRPVVVLEIRGYIEPLIHLRLALVQLVLQTASRNAARESFRTSFLKSPPRNKYNSWFLSNHFSQLCVPVFFFSIFDRVVRTIFCVKGLNN